MRLAALLALAAALPLMAQAPHAVLYNGTSWTDLGALSGDPGAYSRATGIAAGGTVGLSKTGGGSWGWVNPSAINSSGQIVGFASVATP